MVRRRKTKKGVKFEIPLRGKVVTNITLSFGPGGFFPVAQFASGKQQTLITSSLLRRAIERSPFAGTPQATKLKKSFRKKLGRDRPITLTSKKKKLTKKDVEKVKRSLSRL